MENNRYLLIDGELPKEVINSVIYVLHTDKKLKIENQALRQCCSVEVLDIEPKGWQDYSSDVEFERIRYERYIPVLGQKLRTIHGIQKSDLFWERMMGYTLLMHISHCRRVYKAGGLIRAGNFQVIQSKLITSRPSNIPNNEADHRNYFQHGDGGDEQLITVYNSIFSKIPSISLGECNANKGAPLGSRSFEKINQTPYKRIKSICTSCFAIFWEKVIEIIQKLISAKVIAIGVIWTQKSEVSTLLRSFGKVQVHTLNMGLKKEESRIDQFWRNFLAQPINEADDFDKFFFESLRLSAPKSWLESFHKRFDEAKNFLNIHSRVKHLINETLEEDCLLVMAEASDRGIRVIHSEHNYLQHQFLGNVVWYIERKVDEYWTLGWSSGCSEKIKPAGSFFRWSNPRLSSKKRIQILYISTVSIVKPPLLSSGYGESGSINVGGYMDMKEVFFQSLDQNLLSKIYYKDYPKFRRKNFYNHSSDNKFKVDYFHKFGYVDMDGETDVTDLIACSKFLVVDYLSTPWMQGLVSGIPMIILFNRDAYLLEKNHNNFFEELISCGIMHTNPKEAAKFLEKVLDNPTAWWQSNKVQIARRNFLGKNFGSPKQLIERMLGKSLRNNAP